MSLLTWRNRFKRKYRTYRAILIVTNSLERAKRDRIERSLESIDSASARQLREIEREFDNAFNEMVRRYGVIANLSDMERLLDAGGEVVAIGERAYGCLSKHELSKIFRHYENAFPIFPKLAPHARVGIDFHSFRESASQMEFFQLEAFLFEDLASLWNEAMRACSAAEDPNSSKPQVKLASSLVRAAAKAAFNLLEGYLNGLACDILLIRTVSQEEREKLEEWRNTAERAKFLALRDKLLQYPKIAIGAQHPPLQEDAVPSMARVLQLESDVRHALIHPRPQLDGGAHAKVRESVFFEPLKPRVATLCDDVLELILKTARVVGPDFGDVELWLRLRGSNGLFPASSFDWRLRGDPKVQRPWDDPSMSAPGCQY
ncbi:MAG: hypothetical protein ACRD3N_06930 [Terracidiphilus sp.]